MCAPVCHLAIGLEMSNDMIAPAKPMIADKASSAPRFRPLASAICPRPRMFTNTAMTINTAMLVATKRQYVSSGSVQSHGVGTAGCPPTFSFRVLIIAYSPRAS